MKHLLVAEGDLVGTFTVEVQTDSGTVCSRTRMLSLDEAVTTIAGLAWSDMPATVRERQAYVVCLGTMQTPTRSMLVPLR